MKNKKDCKEHTEYGRHLSDSQCPFAENETQPKAQTPGPWAAYFVKGTEPKGMIDPSRVPDEYRIDGPKGCNGVSIIASVHGPDMTANASLIAAAPELLEAVKSMFLYINTYGGEVTTNFTAGGNGEAYKALIAKAEGL